jgi:hypothetical protein
MTANRASRIGNSAILATPLVLSLPTGQITVFGFEPIALVMLWIVPVIGIITWVVYSSCTH